MVTAAANGWALGGVHHVGLTVGDLERSIAFYRDVLGLALIRRRPGVAAAYVAQQTGYPGVVLDVASFRVGPVGGPSLEVVQYRAQAGPPADPATNRAGSSHLCLAVSDLRACYAELRAKGVRFRSEPVAITEGPNAGGLVVYLFDPDGYVLELFEAPTAAAP
jgi:catechol 2,3-dioxygenase-like lactoylglutathione lyase family enzyme